MKRGERYYPYTFSHALGLRHNLELDEAAQTRFDRGKVRRSWATLGAALADRSTPTERAYDLLCECVPNGEVLGPIFCIQHVCPPATPPSDFAVFFFPWRNAAMCHVDFSGNELEGWVDLEWVSMATAPRFGPLTIEEARRHRVPEVGHRQGTETSLAAVIRQRLGSWWRLARQEP